MDQEQVPTELSAGAEFNKLVCKPASEQTAEDVARIMRLGLAGVSDDALLAVTSALKKAVPPRAHNPFAMLDPAKAMHEAVYAGKNLLVHFMEIECLRRQSKPRADNIA